MIRLLLYILLGYVVWRMVKTVMRMVGRSSHSDIGPMQAPPGQTQSPPAAGFSDVKDARFEDIPPSKPKDDKSTPSN